MKYKKLKNIPWHTKLLKEALQVLREVFFIYIYFAVTYEMSDFRSLLKERKYFYRTKFINQNRNHQIQYIFANVKQGTFFLMPVS